MSRLPKPYRSVWTRAKALQLWQRSWTRLITVPGSSFTSQSRMASIHFPFMPSDTAPAACKECAILMSPTSASICRCFDWEEAWAIPPDALVGEEPPEAKQVAKGDKGEPEMISGASASAAVIAPEGPRKRHCASDYNYLYVLYICNACTHLT